MTAKELLEQLEGLPDWLEQLEQPNGVDDSDRVRALAFRLRKVLALHGPNKMGYCPICGPELPYGMCSTRRALDGEE